MAEPAKPSIEGERVTLQTRKWIPHPPKKIAARTVYPFRLSIHGHAFVTQVLSEDAKSVDPGSDRSLGAELRGESLWGHAGKLSRVDLKQLTGGHKGSEVAAQQHAFVRLETPLRQVLEREKRELTKPG